MEYDILISAGLSDDSSFEDHWLERHKDRRCVAFDGTINRCPSSNPNLLWIKKNVGKINNEKTDDLTSLLKKHRSAFLKMDIEGHETDWFRNLDTALLGNILQIVVEFHHSPYGNIDAEVYEKINSTHRLLHLHGNNFSGMVVHEGVKMPITFECTYVNKSVLPELDPNSDPVPSPEDKPNNPGTDIDLNHPPFRNHTVKALLFVTILLFQSAVCAAEAKLPVAPPGTHFYFEIVESWDAEYLGDTPAHTGRGGGLAVRPQVALGDPVYRNERQKATLVGHVTRVIWNRAGGGLEVEVDPLPLRRIAVGDELWVDLNPTMEEN